MNCRFAPLLFVVIAIGLAPAVPAQPNVDVVVTPVEAGQERIEIQAVGESRATRSITLFPEASGLVEAVFVDADQAVDAGTPVLKLEDRAEQVAVAVAAVELTDARRLLDRYDRADGSGAFAPSTVDEARRAVEIAELELEQAQIALDERTVTAPFSGHLGLTEVEAGDRINEDTAITTLDDRDSLKVRFRLPERFHGQLAPGDDVMMGTWHESPPTRTAEVQRIDSRIDPASGTFTVEARVPNQDDQLRPGMRFRVQIALEGAPAWRLPETALLWGDNGAYAWRIVDGQAERIDLELIARERRHVLVNGPLEAGDDVVSEGTQRLRPGIEVNLIDAETLDTYPALEARREAPERP